MKPNSEIHNGRQEAMGVYYMKGNSDLTRGKTNHIEVVKYWNKCLERVWQLCPWRFSELDWTEAGAI